MSLRNGKFKQALNDASKRDEEAKILFKLLCPLIEAWQKHDISDAQMASLYLLTYNKVRQGKNYLQGKLPQINEEINLPKAWLDYMQLEELPKLSLIWKNLKLKGIPHYAHQSMYHWCEGDWPLILTTQIPTPNNLLKIQCAGKRYVTMVKTFEGLKKMILGKRDALSFMIHDLQHADKFFHHPVSYPAQVGFYSFLEPLTHQKELSLSFSFDPQFKHEFEYTIADMNAHPEHQIKYLFNAFREHYKRHPDISPYFPLFLQENLPQDVASLLGRFFHTNKADELDFKQIGDYFYERGNVLLKSNVLVLGGTNASNTTFNNSLEYN